MTVGASVSAVWRTPCVIPRRRLMRMDVIRDGLVVALGASAMGDKKMERPKRRRSRLLSRKGNSLADLLIAVGIIASVLGAGLLSLDRGYLDLATAKKTLVDDLRRAR